MRASFDGSPKFSPFDQTSAAASRERPSAVSGKPHIAKYRERDAGGDSDLSTWVLFVGCVMRGMRFDVKDRGLNVVNDKLGTRLAGLDGRSD